MRNILIIDALNVTYRGFFGMAGRPGSDISATGRPSAAIVGFINYAVHLHTMHPDALVIIAYENGRSERRMRIHPEYKANRSERPEEFVQQLMFLQRLWAAWPARLVSIPGAEADDVVAAVTIESMESAPGCRVFIASSDKDFATLLSLPGVSILRPGSGSQQWDTVDAAVAITKWGVRPQQFTQYLALTGDKSDGYDGVQGVGPKTAVQLLNQHGGLDGIIESARSGRLSARLGAALCRDWYKVERNLQLAEFDNVDTGVLLPAEVQWLNGGTMPERGSYDDCARLLGEWGLGGHLAKLKRIRMFGE